MLASRAVTQPEINYGLFYKGASFVPRRDGLVFQVVGEGYWSPQPESAATTASLGTIYSLREHTTNSKLIRLCVRPRAAAHESYRSSDD
jgi:hypothetical protein